MDYREKVDIKQRKGGTRLRTSVQVVLLILICIIGISPENTSAVWIHSLVISLEDADWTLVGEDNGDWTGYFASPAGDVNGDGLGDVLVGAPMAGDKVCPYPLNPDGTCPGLPKGAGVAYLVLGREGALTPDPLNLADADASFIGCEISSMTARQLYTAGDVNGDGYDDIVITGWKCGENYTGKAYLMLGRPDVEAWGQYYPLEQADASFLGENQNDFLSYYVSSAGDINSDGYDDILITATHHEYDEVILPGAPEENSNTCKSFNTSSEIYDVALDAWAVTDPLQTERMNHTAVLVAGKVLVAGGQNKSSYLASSEEFDPAAGTWAFKGNLNTARTSHTMTLLSNGKILVAGGQNADGILASAEIYDPATEVWTATGSLAAARTHHTASLLPDGTVLVAGGEGAGGFLASAEIYDPATGLWSAADSLGENRADHTAAALADGKILVAGGVNSTGTIGSVEIYDPAGETWAASGGLITPRANHTATLLLDGKILVAGGQNSDGYPLTVELYDPAAGTWTATGSLKEGRAYHTATLLADGRVLAAAGQNLSGSDRGYEIYDPAVSLWSTDPLHTFNTGRANHIAVTLPDSSVLVSGGRYCTDFGKVYLILGRQAADWGLDFDLANADATFLGEAPEDRIGRSTAAVGDVNNDGYEDFLIGAISSDSAAEDAGENYLFLGRATPDDVANYDPSRPWWGQDYSVAGADASFTGENAGDESGRRVAWAGDVNGDGLDDMLMQSALNDYTGIDAGISYLVLGREAADWGMRFPLANADASFVGENRFDQSGRRLSGAGDVNDDGYDDFIIGAPHNQDASQYETIIAGKAYIIFGRANIDWGSYFPLANADLIYEGKPEIGVAGYDMGWLNDFNGDGIDDFLIAAYGGRNNDHVPGEVYILFGSATPVPVQFITDVLDDSQVRPILRYTGEYWEPNGWEDISTVEIILDTESADRVVVHAKYDLVSNQLFLFDDAASTWLGPCTPGVNGVLDNGTVRLECGGSQIFNDNNHTLRVGWRIKWLNMSDAMRMYHVYLRAVDLEGNDSGNKNMGTTMYAPYKIYLPILF